MDPSQAPKFDRITLEKIRVQVSQMIDTRLLSTTEVDMREIMTELMIRLRLEILGQHNYHEYTVRVEIPKNWWEHLKQEKFPKWYLKRWPVKETSVNRTITFDHKKLFPYSEMKFPEGLGPVVFHSNTSDFNVYKK